MTQGYSQRIKKEMASLRKSILKLCSKSFIERAVTARQAIRRIQLSTDMFFHPKEMKWYCPCCNLKFRRFIEGNFKEKPKRFNPRRYEHIRQDVLCPACRALPRHRILAAWCDEHMNLLKSSRILYFAPEYSMMLWMKRKRISCTTADLYKKADLKMDIQSTGLADNSYDVIFCNHVLEHVDDFRAALKEMFRILKPNGHFICSFPMDPKIELLDEDPEAQTNADRIKRFGQNDHKRMFGMKAEQFLAETGFSVNTISGETFPEEILPVIGPADYDINRLFDCVKQQ